MELLYILVCAGIPFYLIYDALKDADSRSKTVEEFRADPLSFVFMLSMFVGWVSWCVWLISNGRLSSGYFGVLAIASLVCSLIWEKIKRGRKKARKRP